MCKHVTNIPIPTVFFIQSAEQSYKIHYEARRATRPTTIMCYFPRGLRNLAVYQLWRALWCIPLMMIGPSLFMEISWSAWHLALAIVFAIYFVLCLLEHLFWVLFGPEEDEVEEAQERLVTAGEPCEMDNLATKRRLGSSSPAATSHAEGDSSA